MKSPAPLCRSGRLLACLFLCSCFIAGCASQPRVDWKSRIGNFTFDQVVLELGPPDKSAKLTDGTVVAEWLTARGFEDDRRTGMYYTPRAKLPTQVWVDEYNVPPAPNFYLRLTYGPDAKLSAWKRVVK